MLSTLHIKNLALVADLTLDLQPGFNALTGETGAGKSIIIGALNLVLGERADRLLIRSGCESCSVEAVMDLGGLQARVDGFLDANGLEPCEGGQLVLKRVFTTAGANRQFINGSPTTLSVLSALGEELVDIHGPHDHQSLLQPAKQLALLDAYGKLEAPREAFAAALRRRTELEAEKAALIVDERTYAQQLDLLRFQVREISDAKLQPDEEAQVEQDYQQAKNAARLLELSQAALELLNEGELSLLTQAGRLGRTLQELQRLDGRTDQLVQSQQQAVTTLQDLQTGLSRYQDQLDPDPARLQELEERLDLIHSLKRKYGANAREVLAFGETARGQLEQLEQREVNLARLQAELRQVDAELARLGRELSAQRRQVIPRLAKVVTQQLTDLGFKQSHFEVTLASAPLPTADGPAASWRASGLDTVEFLFAPNVGEPPRPLRLIASSGELARVMLALKTVLADVDAVPVLVFDEVDANVGGETAPVLGEKMREIGRRRQVLCITHLAPVAASAAAHYVVTKEVKDGRTISDIQRLDRAGRVVELSRMLGGQFEAARRHAEALLQAADTAGAKSPSAARAKTRT